MMKPQKCPKCLRFLKTPLFFRPYRSKAGKKGAKQCQAIPSAILHSIPHMRTKVRKPKSNEKPPFLPKRQSSRGPDNGMKIITRPAGSEGYSVPTPGPRSRLFQRERIWTSMMTG